MKKFLPIVMLLMTGAAFAPAKADLVHKLTTSTQLSVDGAATVSTRLGSTYSSSGTNVTNKYGVAGAKKEFVNIRNSSGAYSTAGDVYVKYTLEAELVT